MTLIEKNCGQTACGCGGKINQAPARSSAQGLSAFMKKILLIYLFTNVLIIAIGAVLSAVQGSFQVFLSSILASIIAALFASITIISIIFASKFDHVFFLLIILGVWAVKFVLFVVAIAALKNLEFIDSVLFYIFMIITICAMLIIDTFAVLRFRLLG